MPVFGFVLTLAGDAEQRGLALQALAHEPGLSLGAPQMLRLPVVLEIAPAEPQEDRIARWLRLPGVVHVDYAFADFEDVVEVAPAEGNEP
jgi:hypothetical protein